MSVTVIRYDQCMARWQPDARGRLLIAASELYVERGFEQTTVADIAERAGLTERTFFRHFADKREVLFGGQDVFRANFVGAVASAAPEVAPFDAVAHAVRTMAAEMHPRRSFTLERQKAITATPALQEREQLKMSAVTEGIAGALRDRGVTEPAASLAAQSGIAVFHVAFVRWADPANDRTFVDLVDEAFATLKTVTA
jgi:AcrR family transcriptional regulator